MHTAHLVLEEKGLRMEEAKTYAQKEFEPNIIAFVCNWCTYAAADLAGTSRIQYPPNVKIIRLMCSGSVDPVFVIKALIDGVDGVLIGGCHLGDCHYQDGNYKAKRRMQILKTILENTGFESERIWVRWISASEGKEFANTIIKMVETMRKLGPNPLKKIWNA